MDIHKEVKEFDVLGHNIRLKESDDSDIVSPQEIVDLVMSEANEIKKVAPKLADSQIAVLVALQVAKEKLTLEKNYKNDIASFQTIAKDALKFVEEVTPTSH